MDRIDSCFFDLWVKPNVHWSKHHIQACHPANQPCNHHDIQDPYIILQCIIHPLSMNLWCPLSSHSSEFHSKVIFDYYWPLESSFLPVIPTQHPSLLFMTEFWVTYININSYITLNYNMTWWTWCKATQWTAASTPQYMNSLRIHA